MIRFLFVFLTAAAFVSCTQFNTVDVINFDTKKVRVQKLNINSEAKDYGPFFKSDGKSLFFVSNREGSKAAENAPPSDDIWVSLIENIENMRFREPFHTDKLDNFKEIGINTHFNEGSIAFNYDGNKMYFTGCGREDDRGACDIYVTENISGKWTMPVNLKNINSEYWESQPSLTNDEGKMYFSSTRPKNPNQKLLEISDKNIDIWVSSYNYDDKEWSKPENLEIINSEGREMSPCIAADNVTLLFASDYYQPNYGGLDLYVTRYDPKTGTWSKPQNLGKSVNTSNDELMPTLAGGGAYMIYTSARGDEDSRQLDLYMAKFPKPIILKK